MNNLQIVPLWSNGFLFYLNGFLKLWMCAFNKPLLAIREKKFSNLVLRGCSQAELWKFDFLLLPYSLCEQGVVYGTTFLPIMELLAGLKWKLGDDVRPQMIQVLRSSYKESVHEAVEQFVGQCYELETRRGPPFCWTRACRQGLPSNDKSLLGYPFARVYNRLLYVFKPVGL